MATTENDTEGPTVRGLLGTITVLVLAGLYLAVGFAYAASNSLSIAGMSGPVHYVAYAMQVLAWPLAVATHG